MAQVTIPLFIIFDNDKFINAPNIAQLAVLKIIHFASCNHELEKPLDKRTIIYSGLDNNTYYRHRKIIGEIVQELAPLIIKYKKIKRAATLPAIAARIEKTAKRHKELSTSLIHDIPADNPAPLMPQHSAVSATLKRQSNPLPYANPIKTKSTGISTLKDDPNKV